MVRLLAGMLWESLPLVSLLVLISGFTVELFEMRGKIFCKETVEGFIVINTVVFVGFLVEAMMLVIFGSLLSLFLV